MQRFLVFLMYILVITPVLAQDSYTITGLIKDDQNNPVPFGNAALYNTADSSLATGAVSDDVGRFVIEAKPGIYYLKITFLSYEEKTIQNISISDKDIDLGTIVLRPNSQLLSEVVVQGEKSQMELQLDKRVFNVGQDLSNLGGNAADILDNVPSVTVDIDGNVSLRGSQNVRILIDGKPSGLVGISSNDALRQLQGNMIERIEVITNPSARYDAEGEVGIINIVLKKNTRQGLNGVFNVNTGYPANYGASFNVNYRGKKTNLFANYGFNYRSNPGRGNSYQEYIGTDTTFRYEQNSRRTRSDKGHNLMVGMDYFLNDKNTLTASFLYRPSNGLNKSTYRYDDIDANNSITQTVIRTDREEEPEENIELSLNYRKEFNKKDQTLTADFKYIDSDEVERSDFRQSYFPQDSLVIQRSSNTENERNILFQTDYIHPFSEKGKIEAGLKSTSRVLNNDFIVEQLDDESNWFVVDNFNNNFIYTERIHAAYIMAGNEFNRFSLQTGLRGEFSDITTELKETKEENRRTYFNLFPSAHIAYKLSKDKTIQLSYSYRLSRPGFRELIPFSNFSDNRVLFTGNPNLNPEYTHSIEAGYLINWENGSLLSSTYYRHRIGVFERIRTQPDSMGRVRIIPINLSTENAYGLEFNLSYTIGGWWRLNGNFNFYRAITEGQYEGSNLFSDTYTWNSRFTSKMTILKKYDFQAGINYRAPRQVPQGKDLAMYSIDLGLSRDVLKNNGTLTLSVRDLLNSRKRRSITEFEGLYSESEFQWRSRQIMLTFSYRLNQKKESKNRERDREGNDNNDNDFDEF